MPGWLGQIGMQAASGAVDAGLGLLLEGHNDKRQLRQQDALNKQQLQIDYAKMDAQQRLGLEMWNKTNIGAQKEHIEKAGMNPAMMYAMGGAGGSATTAGGSGGGSVSASKAPTGGGEILGMQMIQAQRQLIEAQTQKTVAETSKIGGVDTKLGETQIQSLTQGIQNQKAVERLTQIQGNIAGIEQELKTDSYEDVLNTIRYTWRKTVREIEGLTIGNEINEATKDEKIKMVEGELVGLGLANELKREQIQMTDQQTKKMVQDIAQGWKELNIQQQNAITNALNSETARMNAKTSLKQFLEQERHNAKDEDTKAGFC